MTKDTEYTTVSVRVTNERYERWDDYLSESDAENMSQLVRMSVKHEIDGTADAPQAPENAIEPDSIGEISEGINSLQQAMKDVETRISVIEKELEDTNEMDLEDAVFRNLPTPPEKVDDPLTNTEPSEWASTPGDIARSIVKSTERVKEALERLDERGGQVKSVYGGEPPKVYYWRRE